MEKSVSEIDAKIQALTVTETELTTAKEETKRRLAELSYSMQSVNRFLEGIETVLQRISLKNLSARCRYIKNVYPNNRPSVEMQSTRQLLKMRVCMCRISYKC